MSSPEWLFAHCASHFLFLPFHINSSPTSAIIPQLSFSNHCPSFLCHSFTSTVFSSIFYSDPQFQLVCLSVYKPKRACPPVWQIDSYTVDFDGEDMIYSGRESREVTGNTPSVLNWQQVHQTSLNRNRWVCQLHNTTTPVSDRWCVHDTFLTTSFLRGDTRQHPCALCIYNKSVPI